MSRLICLKNKMEHEYETSSAVWKGKGVVVTRDPALNLDDLFKCEEWKATESVIEYRICTVTKDFYSFEEDDSIRRIVVTFDGFDDDHNVKAIIFFDISDGECMGTQVTIEPDCLPDIVYNKEKND